MKRTKTYPNQRLQLDDYEAVSKLILDEFIRSNRVLIMPDARGHEGLGSLTARILGGFDLVNISGGSATLQRGKGIFPYWHQGEYQFGALLGEEDPAEYLLDFSTLPDTTHAIYVRLVQTDTGWENRVFWDPGTPAEYVDSVASRLTPSWEYRILDATAAPPGNGWVAVWMLETVAGVINPLSVMPLHHLYFEGYAPVGYPQEWGDGANDRNADRRLYGVQDLNLFAQLVRRQLADIIGDKHYSVPSIDLSKLVIEHSQIDGHHVDVLAETLTVLKRILVQGTAADDYALAIKPEALGEDKPAFWMTAKGGTALGVRNFLTMDRQGVISSPNLMMEHFLYPAGAAESIPIPGQRWGRYYTPAAGGCDCDIEMARGLIPAVPAWEDNMPARKCRVTTPTLPGTVFGGIRTGGFSNGQAGNGFWRVRNQPWMIASFLFPASISPTGGCDIGFINDRGTLDSFPSRVWVRFVKASNTALLYALGKTGLPVAGTVDLLSPIGNLDPDKLYTLKISIVSPNEVRATLDSYMETDTVVLPVGKELEESYSGGAAIVGYSAFAVARDTNGAGSATTVDLYRFDVGDLSYLGMQIP